MDQKIQTSFIPKKPIASDSAQSSGTSFLTFISLFIFFIMLLATGGSFFYERYLVQQTLVVQESLKKTSETFNEASIEQLIALDKRIESAKQILSHHTVLTPLFDLLGDSILQTVRFGDLTYSADATGKISLVAHGQAVNYSSIAFQSDVISKKRFIKNPVFSDLNLDQSGNVGFNFNATVDPQLLLYKNNLPSVSAGAGNN